MKNLLFILLLLSQQQVYADIYKCQDKDSITFVDSLTKENFKHCILMTERKQAPSARSKPTATQTPIETVKIDSKTQNSRDQKRKQILLSELKTEEDALQLARNAGADKDVRLHQENIELISKEIQRIK